MTDILCNRHKYNYYLHRVTESPHWLPHISIPPSPTPHPPTQPPPPLLHLPLSTHSPPPTHPKVTHTTHARTRRMHAQRKRARKKTKPATAAAWSSESRFPWALLTACVRACGVRACVCVCLCVSLCCRCWILKTCAVKECVSAAQACAG